MTLKGRGKLTLSSECLEKAQHQIVSPLFFITALKPIHSVSVFFTLNKLFLLCKCLNSILISTLLRLLSNLFKYF